MKKYVKKTISLFLCALLVFSCLTLACSAATKETVKQYAETGGYLAIGDSIGKGCGSEGSYIDRYGNKLNECGGQYNDNDWRYVQGSYTAQIADAVGCKAPELMTDSSGNFWPCTFGGLTTSVCLDLYGIPGYTDSKLKYEYYDLVLDYFGYDGSLSGANSTKNSNEIFNPETDGKTGNIIDVTKKASLITVELGMCDVFYRAYRIIVKGSLQGGLDDFEISLDSIGSLLSEAVGLLEEGYNQWLERYPILIKHLKNLNPDAQYVMVGSFNMVNQMTILDQLSFPLGSIFSNITDKMNQQYKKWSKEFDIPYADISNTEALATEQDWSVLGDFMKGNNSFAGSHPTQNGYDYITRQILTVLPEETTYDTFAVDIGRFTDETVKNVFVDGVITNNYEIKNHVLILPYSPALVTSITLETTDCDGNTGFQYYSVRHMLDGSYKAYRVFGRNNTAASMLRPFELIKFLFDTVIGLIKGEGISL